MFAKTIVCTGISVISFAFSSEAALLQWQSAVGEGAEPAYTNFTTITSPVVVDVGALSGDRSFEFIVKADIAAFGASAALIGTFDASFGRQGLKVKQWQGSENTEAHIGVTAFGVLDHESAVDFPSNVDTHLVFTSDGTSTFVYLNGTLAHTFGLGLALTGTQLLGGVSNGDAVIDPFTGGSIYGFVSYNSALSADEVSRHYSAYLAPIPEPGALALVSIAGLAGIASRRRRIA